MKPLAFNLTTIRLVLSGSLLGIAVANVLFGVDLHGEILAGVVGAGTAAVALKLSAAV